MSTATEQMKNDLGRDPEDLAREADTAREHLEGTIDELMHQFAPGELVDKGISFIRSKADFDFIQNLTRQVESNPIPTILAAVSLIWLMNASKQPSNDSGSQSGESLTDRLSKKAGATRNKLASATSGLGSSAHDTADRTRETGHRVAAGANDVMHRVSDASRSTAESVRNELRSARREPTQMLREHPVLMGALAGVIGAGLGSLLARTSSGDREMGKMSDTSTDTVTEKVKEKLHEAQEKVTPEKVASGTVSSEKDSTESAGLSDAQPSSTMPKTPSNNPASGSSGAEGSSKAEGSSGTEGSPGADGSSRTAGSAGSAGSAGKVGARQPGIKPPKLDPASPGANPGASKPQPGNNY